MPSQGVSPEVALTEIYSCRTDWAQFVLKVAEIREKVDMGGIKDLAPIGMLQVDFCK